MKHIALIISLIATPVFADPVTINAVEAVQSGPSWRFNVTVTHPDTGWDHYADGWRIEDSEGNDLGTRVLAHPHVNEQPFTRSLTGVRIPDNLETVYVRARCSVDGWNDDVTAVKLMR